MDFPRMSGPQKGFCIERFPPLKVCGGGQTGLSVIAKGWSAGVCLSMKMHIWAGSQAGLTTSAID